MILPNFLEKIFSKKEIKPEYFLIFLFNEDKIKAIIFRKSEGKGEILNIAQEKIVSLEDWEEIIKKGDLLISKVSQNVPQENIKNVVFGLPSTFLEGEGISSFYLEKLKKFSSDLLLKPIGFIAISEALVKFLNQKESTPLNGIIIEIGKEDIYLTVCLNGKIVGKKKGERKGGVNFCEEIKEILNNNFPQVSSFPSRLLLFFLNQEEKNYDFINQEILSYPWTEKTKFLHFPRTEIIKEDNDLLAVISAFASEIKTETSLKSEEITDIKIEKPQEVKEENKKEMEEEIKEESFGFLKDQDVGEVFLPKEEKTFPEKSQEAEIFKEKEEERGEKEPVLKRENLFFKKISLLISKTNLKAIVGKIKTLNLLNKIKPSLFYFFLIFLIFLILGGFLYWYFPKGEVTLYLSLKTLEKEEEINIQKGLKEADFKNKIIPAREFSFEKSLQKTAKATGEKIVGEKAKGEVVIYNKTNYPKKFPAGTIIYGPQNLRFVLEEEVNISSQSSKLQSDETVIITPGKAKVKVIALEIGAEGNLPKDTEFKIGDYSKDDFKAKNEDAPFSGGTSRQVTVVSEKDQKKLLTDLISEAEKDIRKEIEKKLNNEEILKETLEKEVISEKYSKKVDEEAEDFTLNLVLKFKVLTIKKDDFKNIINEIVRKNLPKGYTFSEEEIISEIKEVESETKDRKKIKVYLKAFIFPKVDENKIRKILAGKNPDYTPQYLKGILEIKEYKVFLKPKFPGPLYTYPYRPENIKILIKKM